MSKEIRPIRFKSPEELKEEEIERRIKERGPEGEILGGIVFEEEIDPETQETKKYIYIGNPYEERPLIIKLETEATREEVEEIKRQIIPMRESFEILVTMAQAYKLRQPLLIEGPTAIGKTFLVNKFTELLYGKGVKPIDFYCSGQTDVSELMVKWVPRGKKREEEKIWENFLKSPKGEDAIRKIAQEVKERSDLSPEQKLNLIHRRLQELAKSIGLSGTIQWQLQYGAVPKAMGLIRNKDGTFSFDEQNGEGFIIHIQEVGLAEPQVINALLQLRGERGKIADEIQLWESGGIKIKAGPKFWVVFSTNPPEEYLARNEVDPALARGVVFIRMGELSEESLYLAAEYYFTYRIVTKPEKKPEGCILDIYNYPEIGKAIAQIIAPFHMALYRKLREGEKGRRQRIPLTLDDMAKVAEALIYSQIRSKETGQLDLTETLKQHISLYYLDRLADKDLREEMEKILNELFEPSNIETLRRSEEILKGGGKSLPPGAVIYEGKIISRREYFDKLVEKYSLSEEEKRRREEIEKQILKNKVIDQINSVLENPQIPEEIKTGFKEIEKIIQKKKRNE